MAYLLTFNVAHFAVSAPTADAANENIMVVDPATVPPMTLE